MTDILFTPIRLHELELLIENSVRKVLKETPKKDLMINTPLNQLLETNLVDTDLSVRALNTLKAADIETLGELVSLNKNDLLKLRNFGKKTLVELEYLVSAKGLQFGYKTKI